MKKTITAAILIITLASCTKEKQCSEVTSVKQAPTPVQAGYFEVVTKAGDTIYTRNHYKVGQIICE